MDLFLQDFRYALRMLVKSPSFSLIAITTLAIGIGCNTALFSIINGVLLNPLPYSHPEQLMALYGRAPGFDLAPISYLNFLDWEANTHAFSSMAMYHHEDYNLTGSGEAQRLSGYLVSSAFFRTLDVAPLLGRDFQRDEDQLGKAPVVILSGGFWKRQFGSSTHVIGTSLVLNGVAYTIIGVMPPDFSFYAQDCDVFTMLGQFDDPMFRDRAIQFSSGMIGRLQPGVSVSKAAAELENTARNLAAAYPDANKGIDAIVVPMKEDITTNIQPLLIALLCAVGFVLLIACASVANLLLARSMSRAREFTLRSALGASQFRIIRQLLSESVLMAGLGGACGLIVALIGVKILVRMLRATLPRANEVSLDSRVLLFTLAISVLSGVIFGLAPALKASRLNLQTTLKEGGRGTSASRYRLQAILVAAEVALSLVLLIGAGLMMRTLAALWGVDPGFNPDNAVTFSLSFPTDRKTDAVETRARLRQFDQMMSDVPGVTAVSTTLGSRPMIHPSTDAFWIDGEPKPERVNDMDNALFTLADPGYLEAMGIRLERGRFIIPQDDEHSPPVIVIDTMFAHRYFPGQNPIGKRVHLMLFKVTAEIVGVVGHVKQWGLDADAGSPIQAHFYYSFMQVPDKMILTASTAVAVVLRTQGDPATVMNSVRHAIAAFAPGEVLYNFWTMNEVISRSLAARRSTMILLGVFAFLALFLSCVGIHGVISYLVSLQTREIGVRMALGAQRGDILRLVLKQGMSMALSGVLIGVALSIGLTRLLSHQLFGVTAHNPLTFGGVAAMLSLVAFSACCVPALRATRIDPAIALRCD
jgi:predicted permease